MPELTRDVYDKATSIVRKVRRRAASDAPSTVTLLHDVLIRNFLDRPRALELETDEQREHFYAMLRNGVKWALIDHYRSRQRLKRGAAAHHEPFEEAEHGTEATENGGAGLDEMTEYFTKLLHELYERQPECAEIFCRKVLYRESWQEIMRSTGLPLRTLERRLGIARDELRREVRRLDSGLVTRRAS